MRLVTLLALFALSTPALAQEAAPATQAAKPEKADKNDPNRKICRRLASSSSRLGGPTECHTKAEWKQMSEDSSNAASRNRDSNVRSQ